MQIMPSCSKCIYYLSNNQGRVAAAVASSKAFFLKYDAWAFIYNSQFVLVLLFRWMATRTITRSEAFSLAATTATTTISTLAPRSTAMVVSTTNRMKMMMSYDADQPAYDDFNTTKLSSRINLLKRKESNKFLEGLEDLTDSIVLDCVCFVALVFLLPFRRHGPS